MKRRAFYIILILVFAGTAIISFVYASAREQNTCSTGLCRQLGLTKNQSICLSRDLEKFQTKTRDLSRYYQNQRFALAELLSNANSTDQQIRTKNLQVIEANNDLLRNIVDNILNMNQQLNKQQRQRFSGLCRRAMNCARMQNQTDPNFIQHKRYGYGPGGRFGHGRGQGQGRAMARQGKAQGQGKMAMIWRIGRLYRELNLSDTQFEQAAQRDPNFIQQSDKIITQVQFEHHKLIEILNDHINKNAVIKQLNTFISKRSSLEQRVIEHILLIRDMLSKQQLNNLAQMCRSMPGRGKGRGRGFQRGFTQR